ncbi:uncharacterized protein ATNIH1004_001994 [Aspergillus tanneri]|uniref:Uncharacterized protein n=1 Tax=Aspergillus tanneri TaxID=1220188 RepID=A0A5M9M6X0_9EURO|nr:uncharacterized protein ATNIH1004_001994 [Aspergillus tanneri]KAA8641326.1 hypothetical protein ATNIH1004_001994 [Aspergillus tanneri]
MVVDAGYFAKQGRKVIQRMMHDGHAPLCESDFTSPFGEVVAAGQTPGSQENPEIFIGLRMIDRQIDRDGESSWPSNPLLFFTTYGARAKQGQSVKQEDSSSSFP